jgi:hypothetical protein
MAILAYVPETAGTDAVFSLWSKGNPPDHEWAGGLFI